MAFKAINWTPNEIIGEQKFDAMTDNAEWLFNNTPRAIYTLPGGMRRVEGVRVAAGRVMIAKKNDADSATATVRFGNFFSVRAEPLITTGIVADHQTKIFCVVNGIGKLQPDHQGFNVSINIAAEGKKNDKIKKSFFVAWQALGY